MKNITLSLCLIILTLSCKNNQSPVEAPEMDPIYDTVMQIHDAVMPETATLHRIRKSLKEMPTEGDRTVILDQIKYIDEAEEAMMQWMAEFSVPEDTSQQVSYLKAEKIKIQQVSDIMYDAIRKGQMVLDSIQSQ